MRRHREGRLLGQPFSSSLPMAPPSSTSSSSPPAAFSVRDGMEATAVPMAKRQPTAPPFVVTQATAQKAPPYDDDDPNDGDGDADAGRRRPPFDDEPSKDDSFLRTKKPRLEAPPPLSLAPSLPPCRKQPLLLASSALGGGVSGAGRSRRTNDEIHSTISLCPVTCLIMDTPEFQRLKGIKQLGSADFVYMNCNATRFEHSVGVSDLARRLVSNVSARQPQLDVTGKDVLCVKLAGLLHDVGHGPFSHVYEQFQEYLGDYLNNEQEPQSSDWYSDTIHPSDVPYRGHESVSLLMVRRIFEGSLGLALNWEDLDAPLLKLPNGDRRAALSATRAAARMDDDDENDDDLDFSAPVKAPPPSSSSNALDENENEHSLTTRDVLFVMECIWGRPVEEYEKMLGPGFHGRPPHKEWLYDVVCNRHSGLDVDKIDYYARDERRAFKGAGEIDVPMIEEAVVAWAVCDDPATCHKCRYRSNCWQHMNGPRQMQFQSSHKDPGPRHLMLCYPQKHIPTCMDFFKKRFELHTKIYSHKTSVGTSYMICDILCAADPYFRLPVLCGEASSSSSGSESGAAIPGAAAAKREYAGLPISRAFVDPDVYLRCRDSVLDQIANTTDPNLAEARRLISRLWSRDIYKCAVFKVLDMATERALWELSEKEIVDGMLQVRGVHRDDSTGIELTLERRDILVHKCNIHHGSKDGNPLLQMRFVEKHQLHKLSWPLELLPEATAVQESRYDARLPRHFAERSLRIYSRDSAKESLVRHVFEQWHSELQGEMELTPLGVDAFGVNPDGQHGGGIVPVAFFCSQESNDDRGDDEDDDDEAGHGFERSPRRSPGGSGGGLGQVTPVRRF